MFGFEPPRAPGADVVESIKLMLSGRGRVFFALGGNFAAATPDTYETWKGLRRCDLTVHVTTKLNRSHIVHGREALILPCLGRTEIDVQAAGPQGVTVEDSMSMVHISLGINPPASEHLLSEPAIVARLAAATLGARSRTPWRWLMEDYSRIRDKIEAVFDDFKDFNERIANPGGFRLRNTASERVWATGSGKAAFYAHAVPLDTPVHRARERRLDTVVFTLLSTRSHDQYNTTIYGHDDRYRGVFGQRRVVFINGEDIRHLGMKDGDWVDLRTVWSDGVERRADRFKLVAYDIPRGCLGRLLPRDQPLGPAVVDGPHRRDADVEIHSGGAEPARGRHLPATRRHDVCRGLTTKRPSVDDNIDVVLDDLTLALLRELALAPGDSGMSLPRLGKHLGVGASVLMRRLSTMGPARIGGIDGPGWVRVTQLEDRWIAALTERGRALCASHPQLRDSPRDRAPAP